MPEPLSETAGEQDVQVMLTSQFFLSGEEPSESWISALKWCPVCWQAVLKCKPNITL